MWSASLNGALSYFYAAHQKLSHCADKAKKDFEIGDLKDVTRGLSDIAWGLEKLCEYEKEKVQKIDNIMILLELIRSEVGTR